MTNAGALGSPAIETMLNELGRAQRLVVQASSVATALADLGRDIGIDLPPPSAATADAAQLRAIAGLYFAAELDAAGVIVAAEALAGLHGGGGMPFTLGSAAADVAQFWSGRHDRATHDERAAVFARLFGADTGVGPADYPGNTDFQTDMIELAEALYKLDERGDDRQFGGAAQQARVRGAAGRVVDGLVSASSGLTVFMAEDLLATLKHAFAIFRHDDLRMALRAHDVWGAVASAMRIARLPASSTALHASRAGAGMTVLAWLADAAAHLGTGGGPLVALDHPVIAAAVEWLEVSLRIGEAGTPDTPAPGYPYAQAPSANARPNAPSRSPWAALAG